MPLRRMAAFFCKSNETHGRRGALRVFKTYFETHVTEITVSLVLPGERRTPSHRPTYFFCVADGACLSPEYELRLPPHVKPAAHPATLWRRIPADPFAPHCVFQPTSSLRMLGRMSSELSGSDHRNCSGRKWKIEAESAVSPGR